MKAVRILYLINSFSGGGAERAMTRIVSTLSQEKYEITVGALKRGTGYIQPVLQRMHVDHFHLNAVSRFDLSVFPKLCHYVRENDVDVMWMSLFHAAIVGRIVGRWTGVPILINWEHSSNLGSPFRILLRRLTNHLSDAVIADSSATAKALLKQKLVSNKQLHIVPIAGLDLSNYDKCTYHKKSPVVIGTVANLYNHKGIDLLLKVAYKLTKIEPQVTFIVVGEGSARQELEKQARELKIDDKVEFWGWRGDIPALLSGFDIYFQPSRWEGMGLAVIEAMAAGLPVVASKVGGHKESIQDGVHGFLVDRDDVKGMTRALLKLIRDPSLRKELGQKGRMRVAESYSLTEMCRKLESILDALIKEK